MLWFKKKRKKVHRATGPIFKNQLTRTKVFFIPGLSQAVGLTLDAPSTNVIKSGLFLTLVSSCVDTVSNKIINQYYCTF